MISRVETELLRSLLIEKGPRKGCLLFVNFNIIFACGSDCHLNFIGDSNELWSWKIDRGLKYLFFICQISPKKEIKISKIQNKLFWRFSVANSGGGEKVKINSILNRFSMCSQKYREMIKRFVLYIYFIATL
jgi:hypothetical protein